MMVVTVIVACTSEKMSPEDQQLAKKAGFVATELGMIRNLEEFGGERKKATKLPHHFNGKCFVKTAFFFRADEAGFYLDNEVGQLISYPDEFGDIQYVGSNMMFVDGEEKT